MALIITKWKMFSILYNDYFKALLKGETPLWPLTRHNSRPISIEFSHRVLKSYNR